MLKRAKICVYMAQETDTIGKDSELATTLAQSKPVIVYVPEIKDIDEYIQEIRTYPLDFFHERILMYLKDKRFREEELIQIMQENDIIYFESLYKFDEKEIENKKQQLKDKINLSKILENSIKLIELYQNKPTSLFLMKDEETKFKQLNAIIFENLYKIIAITDQYFFNKRADLLGKHHPLAIQVHLESGLANGVLIARNIGDCVHLIEGLIFIKLIFNIEYNKGISELREKQTNSIFRLITDKNRLTNSFWNFYIKTM